MSQIPTNNDIPSNSKKAQEEVKQQQDKKDARPEIVPFEGEVAGAKRNKGKFWPWMRKMFLSDRKPSEILMSVLEDNVVPGIKDNFRNSIVTGIDSFIYQSSAPAGHNSGNNGISYNNVYRTNNQPNLPKPDPQNQNNNGIDLSNGFVNPCFKTREQARQFLVNKMQSYDYPTLSVHTMYMMMSKHIDYTWDAYGWNREEVASWNPDKIVKHISSTDFPWMIDLPQAHIIS